LVCIYLVYSLSGSMPAFCDYGESLAGK